MPRDRTTWNIHVFIIYSFRFYSTAECDGVGFQLSGAKYTRTKTHIHTHIKRAALVLVVLVVVVGVRPVKLITKL